MEQKVRVASVADFGDERPAFHVAEIGAREVLVVATDDGYFAIDALCTHGFGYLDQGELKGFEIVCPLHEGRFDIRTGEATKLPAEEPVGCYPVEVVDDEVYVKVASG